MKYTQAILGIGAVLIAATAYASPAIAETSPSCSILPQSLCASSTSTDANDITKSSVFQVIIWILRIMTAGIGIAAIGALIYSGAMYSSAGGNSAQVSKAKTIINDTAIGLVAYVFMFIILNWLIPGGIFG